MDRLFRKRTILTKEAHGLPIRSNSSPIDPIWPEKGATLRKKKKGKERDERSPSSLGQVPRVEVNIRNSLMFPGLSDFSGILPSLLTMPTDSLRDQIAIQRQRGGPIITEAEEDILLAEMKDIEDYRQKFSVSPLTSPQEWNGRPQIDSTFPSGSLKLSESSSTPNLLALAEPAFSPPPTSTSFDSLTSGSSIRTKSYGFSGSSGMRDNDYIRRVKKTASSRNLSGTSSRNLSVRSDDSEKTASADKADQRGSVNESERTATPISVPHPPRERKSMLQGLTPAQMKRISAALLEIGGLNRTEPKIIEDEEETLDIESSRRSDERQRYDSNKSEHSTGSSSVFPYHVSPTTSSFAAIEPSSPPDVAPRTIAEAARPVPILTPTKPKPVRHTSTPSNDSFHDYIPGQPRPVGHLRSDGIQASAYRGRSDSSPVRHVPMVNNRTTSLSRSQSVQQAPISRRILGNAIDTSRSSLTIREGNEDSLDGNQGVALSSKPYRHPSVSSTGSNFQGLSPPWSPIMMTPEDDPNQELGALYEVDKEELSALQNRLILKARAEREELRAELGSASSPIYRATTPDVTEIRPIPSSPVQLGNILTPVDRQMRRPAPAPPSTLPQTPPGQAPAHTDDAEKVRDFETRIAAATAALNRTPSSGGKLERRNTKKGAMVISTPTLLSSSVNLAKIETTVEPQIRRAKKMSLRWKLGFKKPSVSSPEISSPPASSIGSPNPQILKEPIDLAPAADLDDFRFPHTVLPSPPGTANPTTGLRQMMSKLGRSDETSQLQTDPVAKFIAAGRAVGLNDNQLNEMLLAKGMLKRSATTASTASTSDASPVTPPVTFLPRVAADEGLMRKGVSEDTRIVRRTLLMPEIAPPASPGFGRKPSIRRKPINLTPEDEKLVAHEPSLQPGIPSTDTQASEGPASLLRPPETHRESSHTSGGSLYDLYGGGQVEKGVEIMEYEDGRVVWGVVDALRDDAESQYTHSRQTSFASSHHSADIMPLTLRHRDRGVQLARPETNLYFTSPSDIGDLIDQLSREPTGNKGRIDFYPAHPATPDLTAPGQFEDAPSPRKTPPAPISLSRPANVPAGGFSPKRQKFVRQGLGKGHMASPSAASFASSHSGGKPVEDRLQALMDRLVKSGATRKV